MFVSVKYNMLVLHTPKCGGSSLARALIPVLDIPTEGLCIKPTLAVWRRPGGDVMVGRAAPRGLVPEDHPGTPMPWLNDIVQDTPRTTFLAKHATYAEIEGFFTADFLRQAKIIVPVRDPFRRAVSSYHYMSKDALTKKQKGVLGPRIAYLLDGDAPISFEDFLADPRTVTLLAAQPQVDWATGGLGAFRLVRTEHLAEDMAGALRWGGLPEADIEKVARQLSGKRHNVTGEVPRAAVMSPEAMRMVRDNYREDIALLADAVTG